MKYKYFAFMLSFIAILLFVGCRKISHNTDVSGSVNENGTYRSMADVTVYLLKQDGNCFSCVNPFRIVQTTNTDENGRFSFDFKSEKGYTYTLAAKKNNYFDLVGGVIHIDKDKNNKGISITLIPYAYLKLHIRNVNPFNGLDLFSISHSYLNYNFYGANVDTIFTISPSAPFKGNEINTLYYGVERNNIITGYSTQVYCPAFDTAFTSVDY